MCELVGQQSDILLPRSSTMLIQFRHHLNFFRRKHLPHVFFPAQGSSKSYVPSSSSSSVGIFKEQRKNFSLNPQHHHDHDHDQHDHHYDHHHSSQNVFQKDLELKIQEIERNDALLERQKLLEDQVASHAETELAEVIKDLTNLGKGSNMKQIHQVMIQWYEPLKEGLQKEIHEIIEGTPGYDRTKYGPLLLLVPAEKMAMITLEQTISHILKVGNSGVPSSRLTREIGHLIEAEVNITRLKSSKETTLNWARTLMKKNPGEAVQLYNKIRKGIKDSEEWTSDMKVKLGAVLVKTMLNEIRDEYGNAIFTLSRIIKKEQMQKRPLLTIKMSPEIYTNLLKMELSAVSMTRFLPMLVPPQPWDNKKYHGAYLQLKPPILKHTSKGQVEAVKRSSMKKVLESLDFLGSIPWAINKPVLHVIETLVEKGVCIGSIPLMQDFDIPSKEEFSATLPADRTDETQVNRLYRNWENRIKKKNSELHSLRCDMKIKLSIAKQFQDDIIYFPHNLDFRGRAYPVPPNLNHIGNDLCRGLLLFADQKPLGKNGLKWLKVHLANLFGNNKISFEDRVHWVDSHIGLVKESATTPMTGNMWWSTAEKPFQALATCIELTNAMNHSHPEEYLTRLPIHVDGSCNGLQHYAGLGKDAVGGAAVNLIDGDKPSDVYSKVLAIVNQKIEQDSLISETDSDVIAAQKGRRARLVKSHVNRKVIKQTVMTSVYGVTKIGARAQVQARLIELLQRESEVLSQEKEREIYWASKYLADITLNSLEEMFVSAKKIMDWLGHVAVEVAKQDQAMSWMTPLGLPVMQPYRREAKYGVRTVLQIIPLVTNSDLLPVSQRKQRTAFPPNFVHSLDSTHMMLTALKMKELNKTFAAVHDSFWTHPCDFEVMSKALRESFVELYSQPILEDLKASIELRFPDCKLAPIPQRGSLDITNVQNSKYFFH